jgi:hypothetical protein
MVADTWHACAERLGKLYEIIKSFGLNMAGRIIVTNTFPIYLYSDKTNGPSLLEDFFIELNDILGPIILVYRYNNCIG